MISVQYRCMAFAGVMPPGTLTVVPGHFNTTNLTSWASFNWSSPNWIQLNNLTPDPPSLVLSVAMQAAESMQIVPISSPAINSSYSLQVYGPALQCEEANDTQVPVFQYYLSSLPDSPMMIMTQSTFERNNNYTVVDEEEFAILPVPFMLQFPAFAPMLGRIGNQLDTLNLTSNATDQFNNWNVDLPPNFSTSFTVAFDEDYGPVTISPLQLWVQAAIQSFVCTLQNTSYDLSFEYTSGIQTVIPRNISYLEPLFVGASTPNFLYDSLAQDAYLAVFIVTTNMLSGNVTTTISDLLRYAFSATDLRGSKFNTTHMFDSSSRILLTGLTAYEDFTDNFWTQNPISYYVSDDGLTIMPVYANESTLWNLDLELLRIIMDSHGSITRMISSRNRLGCAEIVHLSVPSKIFYIISP